MAGKVKIRVTGAGIFGNKGEIKIGTELTLKSEPKGWAGRYIVVGDSEDKEIVTNEKSTERKNLEAQAAGKSVKFTNDTTDEQLADLIAKAK